MNLPLNPTDLASLPQTVRVPGYDRGALTAGVVHLSVGNFHRGHMMVYFDDLFDMGEGQDWAILGAGLRPSAPAIRDALKAQDCLTTLVEIDQKGASARVLGSMIDVLPADPAALCETLSDPAIRIVSLTLTESGYYIDAATGRFAGDHPEMQADAASPDTPGTVFGVLIKALKARRAAGALPFSVLSCDNLPGNGHLTRQTVTGLARLSDPELADWIAREAGFPNCMVDRIVPATTERERQLVSDRFGIADPLPVIGEPFRQWVIEDSFSAGRPPLEKVGVTFVEDVRGFELMKLRILNAAHASMCYPAALLGYHYIHEAMADADIRSWLKVLLSREAVPTLAPLPGVDYARYLETVLDRFSNPEIGDTIPRIAEEGSERQPKFILPAVRDALKLGSPIEGFALETAFWCIYCRGKDAQGQPIQVHDLKAAELADRAEAARTRPEMFLAQEDVFGDLSGDSRFTRAFEEWVQMIDEQGVRAAIRAFAGEAV